MPAAPHPLETEVARALGPLPECPVLLIAASAGADSTALVHLVHRALGPVGAVVALAHLDHGLRPESGADGAFVAALGARLGLTVVRERADVKSLAGKRRLGLEEAGRHARRAFLEAAAERLFASAILLGHTRDDRAETLLLHLARGSGPSGLGALRDASPDARYRRPLLGASRAALRAYLESLGETHREDASNGDLRFARNRIRHEVLPALTRLNPRAAEALARTAQRLEEEDVFLESLVRDRGLGDLALLPVALARRVALRRLREACGFHPDLGHEHVDAALALAHASHRAAATDLPGGLRLAGFGRALRIESSVAAAAPLPHGERRLRVPGITLLPGADLVVEVREARAAPPSASGSVVQVRKGALGSAPLLRAPRRGDRFQALGAPGSATLARYLANRKVPRACRPEVLVLEGAAGLLWIVGHQVAETARVARGEPAYTVSIRERQEESR